MGLADRVVYHVKRRFVPPTRPITALAPLDMARVMDRGCCPYDGYQRGTGLAHGDLAEQIWNDPLFRKALANARTYAVRTMCTEARLMNLFLLIKFFMKDLASQNIIEYGTFRGGSALFMATLLKELYPSAKVYALDTFEGMPEGNAGLDLPPPDDFADTNLNVIRFTAEQMGLDNVEFVKGLIQDTSPDVYAKAGSFGLAHIDVVLYSAVIYAQESVWDVMAPGGYLVYDDATEPTCPGATRAVEEMITKRSISLEQVYPHMVLRSRLPANTGTA
ncbi:MAG TPA: TylF/MycF/NovP-related O-methyltransferase [Rhizomicrobium sp.]|jgi:predicted O-methyltransferase YrrM|nr:TylF/MycF/NovP-related O-methyltransferase [Rhizomicrobium sp.]